MKEWINKPEEISAMWQESLFVKGSRNGFVDQLIDEHTTLVYDKVIFN